MPSDINGKRIDQLPAGTVPAVLVGNTAGKVTQKFPPRAVTDAAGDITTVGDVVLTGKLGDVLDAVIPPGTIALSQLANTTPNRLLAFDSAGHPQLVQATNGMTLTDGQIQPDATGQVPPAINVLIYKRWGRV